MNPANSQGQSSTSHDFFWKLETVVSHSSVEKCLLLSLWTKALLTRHVQFIWEICNINFYLEIQNDLKLQIEDILEF